MRRRALMLLACSLLVAAPAGAADVWTETRVLVLEQEASAVRRDLRTTSRATRGNLERIRRELRTLQIRPSESDVRIERLERRLSDLGRDADRLERRQRLERSLVRAASRPPLPDPYRPPWPEDIRGHDRLIGVGKLVVRLQRSLRDGGRELEAGRSGAAARHLVVAEEALRLLERAGPGDPTTLALSAEAAQLRARLAD